ncbi:MAG: hypothetical protein K2X25_11570 [Caulobacteraceae bacterium]|nr:hypothetical protein [Caulobacteraceae bacterium]
MVFIMGDDTLVRAVRARSPNAELVTPIDPSIDGPGTGHRQAGRLALADLEDTAGRPAPTTLVLDHVLAVIEDPEALMRRLQARAAPGAVLSASFANAAHWKHLKSQLEGKATGRMTGRPDILHSLQQAGWTLVSETPVTEAADETTSAALQAFTGAAASLGLSPDAVRSVVEPSAFVVQAVNGPAPPPVTIAALGMRKFAGVTDARIDHPMSALAGRPSVRAVWGSGGVEIPATWPPGVLVLHRQFLDSPGFVGAIESRIARGWVIVSEIDDDPRHWPQFAAADYRAFRGVHAVSVSTEPLAKLIRQWNPNVVVLPNASPALPDILEVSPSPGEPVRIFFGALNREKDWAPLMGALAAAAYELRDRIEFVIIHDRAFHDALPDIPKTFSATLGYEDYMAALARCDIGLLPLNDTAFNRLKSDVKFVECCATGVVPICSPTIYGREPQHRQIARFASTPAEWAKALRDLVLDPEDRAARRERGRTYVRENRMHGDQAEAREAAFRDLISRRPALEAERQARLAESV